MHAGGEEQHRTPWPPNCCRARPTRNARLGLFCVVGEPAGENITWIYKIIRVGGERHRGRRSAYYRKDSGTMKEGGAHAEYACWEKRGGGCGTKWKEMPLFPSLKSVTAGGC